MLLYSVVSARPFSYLLICYSYPPVLGGSEIEGQRVSDALQRRGHQVKIVCAGGDPMPPGANWVDPYGLRVRLIGGRWPPRSRGRVFALGVAWTLFKERRNYDIAYFLMHGLHVVTGAPVAHFLGKPIVMKFSGSSLVTQMNDSLAGRLQVRFLKKWAARILILNSGMLAEAKEAGFDPRRVAWIPNPVDTDTFRPASPEERTRLRRELNVSEHAQVIVFAGRMEPGKRLALLVASFAQVLRELPGAKLVLIGEGSLRGETAHLARELGVEKNVVFTGRLDGAGVLRWLQAGDVFALVSEAEGLPLVVIEAMAAGLPPLLSDIPAHSQLVDHGVHGWLTETGNQEAIAQGLIHLLTDRNLRNRLAAAARLRAVEQYSTTKVAECYESLFESVLAPR
jgi:glycosyltransferase involved in cell wall biosynthesis